MKQVLRHDQLVKYLSACEFAKVSHKEQKRKYTGEPYFNHVLEVSDLVIEVTEDVNMWCAAVLHDTVEDCGVSLAQISALFGADVADLVEWLTDISKPEYGNRAVRKAMDLRHLAGASPRAKTIKLADLISNSRTIVQHDLEFAKVYIKEKRALLEVLQEGDVDLYARATALLLEAEKSIHERSQDKR